MSQTNNGQEDAAIVAVPARRGQEQLLARFDQAQLQAQAPVQSREFDPLPRHANHAGQYEVHVLDQSASRILWTNQRRAFFSEFQTSSGPCTGVIAPI